MSEWYNEFNSSFWITTLGLLLGSASMCISYAYRSKCNRILLCCGFINIERDVLAEEHIDEIVQIQPVNVPNLNSMPTSRRGSFTLVPPV